MFDRMYSQMVKKVDYRVLAVIPPIVTLLLGIYTLYAYYAGTGLQFGMDFKGGTWMNIITDVEIDSSDSGMLANDLKSVGLEDPKILVGRDIESGKNKVSVATSSIVNKSVMYDIVSKYVPDLRDVDVAAVEASQQPPESLKFKLSSRLNQYVDVNYSDGILRITALDLNEAELESILKYTLNGEYDVRIDKKNFNLREVGPTLGQTFREQGKKAILLSFILMALVVFFAFRVFVPSVAVLQAAVCDVLIAVSCMSLFNIPLDSASLGALLMLIGYSVDTYILLTVRLLKEKAVDVDEGIDKAMKTGIMMTATTVGAMIVTIIVTTYVIQIPTLNSIASVLVFGLIADVFSTWWTNAGMLKWYLNRPKSPEKRIFKFNIFKE